VAAGTAWRRHAENWEWNVREACHGGDFNGVDCRRLMATANRFCDLWLELIPETHDPIQSTVAVDKLRERMEQCQNLLGKLGVMFSMVLGVDFLLPTPEEIETLKTVIEAARVLWLRCGFNIDGNPKAHLMFDGHLLAQFIKHGGPADETEDPMEFDHQEWKKEKDRTRSVKDFKLQQKCQTKRMRRKNHSKVRRIINSFNERCNQKFNRVRKEQDANKAEAKVAVKEERRATVIQAWINRNNLLRRFDFDRTRSVSVLLDNTTDQIDNGRTFIMPCLCRIEQR
jgi:hypothetical protein